MEEGEPPFFGQGLGMKEMEQRKDGSGGWLRTVCMGNGSWNQPAFLPLESKNFKA